MKTKWTSIAFIIFLALAMVSCATTNGEKKTEKKASEKKEEPSKKEVTKKEVVKKEVVKKDESSVDKQEEKAVKKMAKEVTEERAEDYYRIGLAEYNKGDYEDAVEAFTKAVAKNHSDYLSYFGLGQSYGKLEKWNSAEDAYEEVVKIKSDYLPAREELGLLYFHQKKFQEAEYNLKAARILKSKVAEVYYCLGEIEQREHFCKTAIIAYKEALKLNPDYVAARNGLKVAEAACRKKSAPARSTTTPRR